jgi:tRNA-Thr(GGU) m(6)t(6)A37 methyltransferase TsaA
MAVPITLTPIGYVKNSRSGMHDDYWGNVTSEIIISDKLPEECLDGIDTFSHLEIIFYFDKANREETVDGASHPRGNKVWPRVGIFAQRKKDRPNHLGLTIVKLISRKGRTLTVQGLDADDDTPILDIKPVAKEFLPREAVTQPAWMTELMKDYWRSPFFTYYCLNGLS